MLSRGSAEADIFNESDLTEKNKQQETENEAWTWFYLSELTGS